MVDAIARLFNSRNGNVDDSAAHEVDTAVFRQQYIPQRLEHVYDFERDAEKVRVGEGSELVYQDLLAHQKSSVDNAADSDGSSDSEESGGVSIATSGSQHADEDQTKDPFVRKAPRGKRFEDRDSKREHKRQVKEEKREQRSKKMPKHLKKRLVSESSRKRK